MVILNATQKGKSLRVKFKSCKKVVLTKFGLELRVGHTHALEHLGDDVECWLLEFEEQLRVN